jgi:hypothetical protein
MTEVKNRAAALRIFAAFFYLWYIAEVSKKSFQKARTSKLTPSGALVTNFIHQ